MLVYVSRHKEICIGFVTDICCFCVCECVYVCVCVLCGTIHCLHYVITAIYIQLQSYIVCLKRSTDTQTYQKYAILSNETIPSYRLNLKGIHSRDSFLIYQTTLNPMHRFLFTLIFFQSQYLRPILLIYKRSKLEKISPANRT